MAKQKRDQKPKRFVRGRTDFVQDQKVQVFDPSVKRQRTRGAAVQAALRDWERESLEDERDLNGMMHDLGMFEDWDE